MSSQDFSLRDALIEALRHTPTGDNAQHWYFSWKENQIHVYEDQNLADHVLNQDHNATYLSFGCMVEIAKIWAKENHTHIDFQLLDKSFFPQIASFTLGKEDDSSTSFQMEDVRNRRTNRKAYKKTSNFEEIQSAILSLTEDLPVKVCFRKDISKNFSLHIFHSEKYIWFHRGVFLDTTKWIRYSWKEALEKKDGFYLANIRLNKMDGWMTKALRKSQTLAKILYYFLIRFKVFIDIQKHIQNIGHLMLVAAPDHKRENLVAVGRATYRAWLYFYKNDLEAQPQTIASLLPGYYASSGTLPENCPPNYKDFFAGAPKSLQDEFAIPPGYVGFWMLRFGKGPRLKDKEIPLRKEVMSFVKEA